MNTFGKFVGEAIDKQGKSYGAVAVALGVSPAAIGKIVRGETQYPHIWRQLVDHLGLDPVVAEKLLPPPPKAGRKGRQKEGQVIQHFAGRFTSPNMIPILGHAAAGDPDRLVMIDEPSGMTPAIPAQSDAEGAYALYVYGASMVPRYYPGELVYVHPRKPLTPDCFCVAQIGRGQPEGAFIKQFKSWNDGKLSLHQFNPNKSLEFDSTEVFDVHRIVGSGDD